MFKRLQQKWKVSPGGLGQFVFFRSYVLRIFSRLSGKKNQDSKIVRLAIFSSGTGTNAQKIIDHFKNHPFIRVLLIVSNKSQSGAIQIAKKEGLAYLVIEKEKFFRGGAYINILKNQGINFIVLAGFLWKIPEKLIAAYRDRIINIHPALLPKYGGKGLYGHHVHETVIASGDKESGITIHYVDEFYDHGKHIFQEKVLIEPGDTPETLAKKVQTLEHLHFPKVIEEVITTRMSPEKKNLR